MEAQTEKERRIADLEEKIKANKAEQEAERELKVFNILNTGWAKAVYAGTVDWDDLIERLETALETARRMQGYPSLREDCPETEADVVETGEADCPVCGLMADEHPAQLLEAK